MSARVRCVASAAAIAFVTGGAAWPGSTPAVAADRAGAAQGPGLSSRSASAPEPAGDGLLLRSAAATGTLPAGCQVDVGEPTGYAYLEGRKTSTLSRLKLPKAARSTLIESPLEDDAWHYIAVDPNGRAYDSSLEYGLLGDVGDLSMLGTASVGIGSTLKGIVDLATGAEYTDDDSQVLRPSKLVYAVTSTGRMYAIPVTFLKGRPRLGTPAELRAKGVSGLRGVETLGRHWTNGKVDKDVLLAHTKDGRLVELTVDRTRSRPTLSSRTIAARGWGSVAALALGWCETKALQSTTVIVAIGANRSVTAYLDPTWNDASLRGAKTIRLDPWKRAAPNTLF